MKKNLNNLLNVTLCISMIFGLFSPLGVRASAPTKDIYIVWDCDDEVCVSDAITVTTYEEQQGVRVYEDNNIPSSNVHDSVNNKTLKASDVTGYKNSGVTKWYLYETLPANIRNYASWTDLDVDIHEDPQFPRAVDPTGAKDGATSIAHNGDREYRIVIYDSKYESLTFNVDPNNYSYYLGGWDPIFTNPTLDISNSTKDSPVTYETYLLEDTLKFKAGAINNENITDVKALDVTDKGVTITKNNGEFTVKFNSNYFSEVTFEVTGSNGGKYYFKVNRVFVKFADNSELVMRHVENTRKAYAEFIYPATATYSDYDVIATITTADKVETKILTATSSKVVNPTWNGVNPDEEYITATVLDAGVNLKKVRYALDIDKNVSDVSITVTKKNATSSSSYGGTFGGYSKGVSLDIEMYKKIISES